MSGAASLVQFAEDPGAWAAPELVAPVISDGLRPATASRLMASARTGKRASALLAGLLGAPSLALSPADAALVTSPGARLLALAHAAGAVRHAVRVRALVRGPEIAALAARIGPEARAAALQHTPAAPLPPTVYATGDLAADIAADGAACVAAWLAELPAWAAARLRLAHPWPADGASPALAALLRRLGQSAP